MRMLIPILENPVIHVRSFGENPKTVAEKVIAYGRGLETGGILSVSKHFPGHGDTDVDSHQALPAVYYNRARLDSVELYPFKEAIQAGLGGVMVGHLQVPALEPDRITPSSLSHSIVTDLLRGELGFNGLVFTDALAMKGVAAESDVTVKALKAGNDMVLVQQNVEKAQESVVQAIKDGRLTMEEIDAKCRRILAYKYRLGLSRRPMIPVDGLSDRIHTPEAQALVTKLRTSAVTVLGNYFQILPLTATKGEIAVLTVGDEGSDASFIEGLRSELPLKTFRMDKNTGEEERRKIVKELGNYRRVVVCITVQDKEAGEYRSFCDHVSTFAGAFEDRPVEESFAEFGKVFRELADLAKENGVKLGIENCLMDGTWEKATCNIGFHPRAWEAMFEEVKQDNFGLEWEPTHQMVQLIDPVSQLRKWCHKIVHVHGKDATIDWNAVRHGGISGAETFVWHRMPGFGNTNWSDIISILRANGYEDDICIEGYHDPVYSGEWEMTGQLHALRYLKWCRGGDYEPVPWEV